MIVRMNGLLIEALSRMLAARGFAVVCCADGAEALVMARRRPFDVALLDLTLPGMNGLALALAQLGWSGVCALAAVSSLAALAVRLWPASGATETKACADSELGNANAADHERAGEGKQQYQRVKGEPAQQDLAKPQGFPDCAL
jgi:CheY-like chemotaxis protein